MSNAPPVFTGFLRKRGGRKKNWKNRFFKLGDNVLSYHVTEAAPPKKKILLQLCLSCSEVDANQFERENMFNIVTDKRTFYIQAGSPQERSDWIAILIEAMEFAKR
eukprot:TRINITY_DN9245_c0_g1_i1.p1 TRINITY_DN9245_c0_g1~~TRINITY_DN9245_c0_g1_i1.p1  ORF type:complete len:106 (-),score=28.04 TRINITY_DN9245_c0_g1_i1:44-361(-)